ncbi:MAG: helix-turn-helix transcriptional regulator [Anaerolineales bacterium]|nr:helix-turn-helix transcriptional regulator [Anaerolineales bacterium]
MSDKLRIWLSKELEKRRWSHGELARLSGISRPLISQVLAGDVTPSADFSIKIAQALGEAPEKVLRLAGILPTSPTSEDDTLQELMELAQSLPVEDREELLKYAKFRYQQRRG